MGNTNTSSVTAEYLEKGYLHLSSEILTKLGKRTLDIVRLQAINRQGVPPVAALAISGTIAVGESHSKVLHGPFREMDIPLVALADAHHKAPSKKIDTILMNVEPPLSSLEMFTDMPALSRIFWIMNREEYQDMGLLDHETDENNVLGISAVAAASRVKLHQIAGMDDIAAGNRQVLEILQGNEQYGDFTLDPVRVTAFWAHPSSANHV